MVQCAYGHYTHTTPHYAFSVSGNLREGVVGCSVGVVSEVLLHPRKLLVIKYLQYFGVMCSVFCQSPYFAIDLAE